MFNSHYYSSRTETKVTPVTRVVEKSITPDRVTDMYDSVDKEVRKNVARAIRVDSNTLKGKVVLIRDNKAMGHWVVVDYNINGTDYQSETFVGNEVPTKLEMCDVLRSAYIETLSDLIIRDTYEVLVEQKA